MTTTPRLRIALHALELALLVTALAGLELFRRVYLEDAPLWQSLSATAVGLALLGGVSHAVGGIVQARQPESEPVQ